MRGYEQDGQKFSEPVLSPGQINELLTEVLRQNRLILDTNRRLLQLLGETEHKESAEC